MSYDPSRETVVAIDLSVALHQIEESLKLQPVDAIVQSVMAQQGLPQSKLRSVEIDVLKSLTKINMNWLFSLDWLGERKPTRSKTVLLQDWKINYKVNTDTHVMPEEGIAVSKDGTWSMLGYWRHEYLKRLEVASVLQAAEKPKRTRKTKANPEGTPKAANGVAYKAGRAHSSNNFKVIKGFSHSLIDASGLPIVGSPGYEADDMAGLLTLLRDELTPDQQILQVTTDTDWLGLVDNTNVFWFCMFGWYPRLRDTADIMAEWSKRRLGTACHTGQDIFDTKALKGDKSDNLPSGCPEIVRKVVDLRQQPSEFHPTNLVVPSLKLKDVLLSQSHATPNSAEGQEILANMGIKPFIRAFDRARDYPTTFTAEVPDLF